MVKMNSQRMYDQILLHSRIIAYLLSHEGNSSIPLENILKEPEKSIDEYQIIIEKEMKRIENECDSHEAFVMTMLFQHQLLKSILNEIK